MTVSDLAWATGLFEGEGCFSWNGGGIQCVLTSTDEDVIRKFHQVIGFGSIYGPMPRQKPHWKPKWNWKCSTFEQSQALIALMWRWLCSRRRARAKALLLRYLRSAGVINRQASRARKESIKADLKKIDRPLWGRQWSDGLTQNDIARKYGVSAGLVSQIKTEMEQCSSPS